MFSSKRVGSRNYSNGLMGEDLVVRHFAGLGYELLHRRWRSSFGVEVDLILIKRFGVNSSLVSTGVAPFVRPAGELVFVEVKTRDLPVVGSFGDFTLDGIEDLGLLVSAAQAARLAAGAEEFLAQDSYRGFDRRFDVALVALPSARLKLFSNIDLSDLSGW